MIVFGSANRVTHWNFIPETQTPNIMMTFSFGRRPQCETFRPDWASYEDTDPAQVELMIIIIIYFCLKR